VLFIDSKDLFGCDFAECSAAQDGSLCWEC